MSPIWPDALLQDGDFDLDSPKRRGGISPKYTDFAISWRYEFKSPTKLVGVPNLWIG